MTYMCIESYLDRIISSPLFYRCNRQTSLLTYLVKNSQSEGDFRIKETTIAMDVFGMGFDFDPSQNPIVRVSISRLRQKLIKYYNTYGESDEMKIVIPTGKYTVLFCQDEKWAVQKKSLMEESQADDEYVYTDFQVIDDILINSPSNINTLKRCDIAFDTLEREVERMDLKKWYLIQNLQRGMGNQLNLPFQMGVDHIKALKRSGCRKAVIISGIHFISRQKISRIFKEAKLDFDMMPNIESALAWIEYQKSWREYLSKRKY